MGKLPFRLGDTKSHTGILTTLSSQVTISCHVLSGRWVKKSRPETATERRSPDTRYQLPLTQDTKYQNLVGALGEGDRLSLMNVRCPQWRSDLWLAKRLTGTEYQQGMWMGRTGIQPNNVVWQLPMCQNHVSLEKAVRVCVCFTLFHAEWVNWGKLLTFRLMINTWFYHCTIWYNKQH